MLRLNHQCWKFEDISSVLISLNIRNFTWICSFCSAWFVRRQDENIRNKEPIIWLEFQQVFRSISLRARAVWHTDTGRGSSEQHQKVVVASVLFVFVLAYNTRYIFTFIWLMAICTAIRHYSKGKQQRIKSEIHSMYDVRPRPCIAENNPCVFDLHCILFARVPRNHNIVDSCMCNIYMAYALYLVCHMTIAVRVCCWFQQNKLFTLSTGIWIAWGIHVWIVRGWLLFRLEVYSLPAIDMVVCYVLYPGMSIAISKFISTSKSIFHYPASIHSHIDQFHVTPLCAPIYIPFSNLHIRANCCIRKYILYVCCRINMMFLFDIVVV